MANECETDKEKKVNRFHPEFDFPNYNNIRRMK